MDATAGSVAPLRPRVLVIRGGAIGDFILTLPAIRLIRESIANCHLEVLGYPGIMDLAVEAGLAEGIRSLEHRTMAPLFAKNAAVDDELQSYLRSFNLVVSYLYDPDGHFRASLERVGVKTILDCPHRVEPGKGHASQQLAKPLERLAMFLDEPDWRRPFFVPSTQAETGLHIALHLGSGSEKKNWPVNHWRQLASQLVKAHPGLRLTIITGEAEEARGISSDGFGPEIPHDCWHALPLLELSRRLAGCHLFLGHDSGISHLAAACGVPSVLLFGPTDPATWAPPQTHVRVIDSESPDLAELPPDEVWTTVKAVISLEKDRRSL